VPLRFDLLPEIARFDQYAQLDVSRVPAVLEVRDVISERCPSTTTHFAWRLAVEKGIAVRGS
jgi:hypothetical protein